ncbi:hypothetical protein [Microbulbifer sp. SSSA005]|uniref:hypothetical protein n=1 Tax=unclassified Microbulbifer TaxID=2619833 RepID=UPI00403A5554
MSILRMLTKTPEFWGRRLEKASRDLKLASGLLIFGIVASMVLWFCNSILFVFSASIIAAGILSLIFNGFLYFEAKSHVLRNRGS